jgi:glutathione S-transferase
VVLYTCSFEKTGGGLPIPLAHPCGRAAKALDDAGHAYEIKQVKGGSMRPWTWPSRARDRAEVEQLSGQRAVPILVLDDGEVITGSGAIVSWARANAPAAAAG